MDQLNEQDADLAIVLASIGAVLEKKKARRRRWWVKPWISRRETGSGAMHLLHNELSLEDPDAFRNYLRMDKTCFELLLSLVHHRISKKDTLLRESLSTRDKLSITLRFLATGETYANLSYSTRIPLCTISLFVPEVCTALFEALKDIYLKVCCN